MSATQVRVSAQNRRHQILELATELFARQGYEGTTTRQLAERAGINEAIIFRHFPSKQELYWEVIEQQCAGRGGLTRLREKLAAETGEREVFIAIAREMLGRNKLLMRLLLYSALEKHQLSERFFRTHVAQYYEVLAEYIQKGIEEGRLRPTDPLLAARGFLGMLVYHFQIQELFGGKEYQDFDRQKVAETYVDIWLQGMERRAERSS